MDQIQWKQFDHCRLAISKLSNKVQVLFGVDCAKSAIHFFNQEFPNDNRPNNAIDIALKMAFDNVASDVSDICISAVAYASLYADSADPPSASAYAASASAYAAYVATNDLDARLAAVAAANAAANAVNVHNDVHNNVSVPYDLYLKAYKEQPFRQEWKTANTIAIAKQIWYDRSLVNMPILADSLQDLGVQEKMVEHMRNNQCGFSDWFLWNLNRSEKT